MSVRAISLRACGHYNFRNGRQARFRFIGGFTLIELLVVIAVIAILAAILVPVFVSAKSSAGSSTCISNLKQITSAWQMYSDNNDSRACPAYYFSDETGLEIAWDFSGIDYTDKFSARPGILSPYLKSGAIHTCPTFKGEPFGRPYTGYAYNTSYIGGVPSNKPPYSKYPCRLSQITRPMDTVIFADGGYGSPVKGQNYLRAPGDPNYSGGTVHFRHRGYANISYADGHVKSTNAIHRARTPECGALSEDDSAYDLR